MYCRKSSYSSNYVYYGHLNSIQLGSNCLLWKEEETNNTEKLIYYEFKKFRDCSKNFHGQYIAFFRAYLVTILKALMYIIAIYIC